MHQRINFANFHDNDDSDDGPAVLLHGGRAELRAHVLGGNEPRAYERKMPLNLAGHYIKTKADLYKALTKNGYKLPAAGASCTTKDYLVGVYKKMIWAPQYEQLQTRPCVDPPHKPLLFKAVLAEARSHGKNLGFDEKH